MTAFLLLQSEVASFPSTSIVNDNCTKVGWHSSYLLTDSSRIANAAERDISHSGNTSWSFGRPSLIDLSPQDQSFISEPARPYSRIRRDASSWVKLPQHRSVCLSALLVSGALFCALQLALMPQCRIVKGHSIDHCHCAGMML